MIVILILIATIVILKMKSKGNLQPTALKYLEGQLLVPLTFLSYGGSSNKITDSIN